ncbi:MAG: ferredoxin [Bacilli bacterium]
MKKLIVNEDSCIGCGACVAIDPDHFDFNENGLSTVISNDDITSSNTTNAIESCPTNAISIQKECDCDDSKDCECDHECHCTDCECDEN